MENLKMNINNSKGLEGFKQVYFPWETTLNVKYYVNKSGVVKSLRNKGKLITLKYANNPLGYKFVTITDETKRRKGETYNKTIYMHRLVAAAFLLEGDYSKLGRKVVDHINFDKRDNTLSNLQIITQSENLRRAMELKKEYLKNI
jgi:hypothetical protein